MKTKILRVTNLPIVAAVGLLVVDLTLKNAPLIVLNPGFWLGIQISPSWGLLIQILIVGFVFVAAYRVLPLRVWLVSLGIVSLSNLWDRLFFGAVRDYLQIWGIWFNLADAAITFIVIILVIKILIIENDELKSRIK